MQRMTQRIDSIRSSSDGTAKTIRSIDEVSFQISSSALNAAVDAACAGEAGKAAVVADQVRSLAQR
jgi:methyl-accepting chemotaxis protein